MEYIGDEFSDNVFDYIDIFTVMFFSCRNFGVTVSDQRLPEEGRYIFKSIIPLIGCKRRREVKCPSFHWMFYNDVYFLM